MKNPLLIPLIIVSVVGLAVGGTTSSILISRQARYTSLSTEYQQLLDDYQVLVGDNSDLQEQFDNLEGYYEDLLTLYIELQAEIEGLVEGIKSLPLLDKMTYYYHLCRMNFNPFYDSQLVFARDLILHGDSQYNGFYDEIDTVLNQYSFFEYGSSMADSRQAYFNCLGSWMLDIETYYFLEEDIFDWVTESIDYRYDDETAYG
ncbi:MAG: DUF3450 domain-containing protein, partial [Asgard group archaeon]|nr:DUF3450 domain-containing protein [Asgard group archaeon]